MTIITTLVQSPQELSSIAEMGDRLSTIDMDRKVGAVVPRSIGGGAGSPSNTMWPGPRTTSMPGMGTRRQWPRPRRDRDVSLSRPRRDRDVWPHQPRRDVQISRRDRDETFAGLET